MLDDVQRATLGAAIDRVIPADDTPGGVAAGALDYLLAQLTHDLAPQLENYRAFLTALEAAAQESHGASFASLSLEAQDALLRRFEADPAQAPFFRRFVEHAQEGFYISPEAWHMIGWRVKG